jgi:iron complex transport system substrate-binding protein
MTRRRNVLRTLGTGAVFGLAGCTGIRSSAGDNGSATRTITDGAGRSVDVPETVERVVGVGPGSLRQIAYLGATDRVVGVEDAEVDGWARKVPYNQANPELRDLPVIGSAGPNAGGNSEKILAVDPDVLFYYGDPSRADSLQEQTETPVVVLKIVDFVGKEARETMYDTWRLVGNILDTSDRAEAVIEFVDETISDLHERTAGIPADERETAYVGAINYKGAHGLATTRKTFPPFRFVNVENVATNLDTDAASVQVSQEQLLTWDPATMFVSAANLGRVREDVRSNSAFEQIDAVGDGAVYSILPHASYHHNYGSILANAYFVGRTLYPDRFDDLDFESKTNAIYEELLGTGLYDELTNTYDAYRQLDL